MEVGDKDGVAAIALRDGRDALRHTTLIHLGLVGIDLCSLHLEDRQSGIRRSNLVMPGLVSTTCRTSLPLLPPLYSFHPHHPNLNLAQPLVKQQHEGQFNCTGTNLIK